jgi:hypothetical protein
MRHYPPEEFGPGSVPFRPRPTPSGCAGWVLVGLITFACFITMMTIIEGRAYH